jgi:hypothetical protein
MPDGRPGSGGTSPDSSGGSSWGQRFRRELASNSKRNVEMRVWVGVATVLIASLIDLLPLGLLCGQLATGGTSLDGDNVGSFLVLAIPAPLFLASVVTAVWHFRERHGPRALRLFLWNVGTFLAAGLVGVVLGQFF